MDLKVIVLKISEQEAADAGYELCDECCDSLNIGLFCEVITKKT